MSKPVMDRFNMADNRRTNGEKNSFTQQKKIKQLWMTLQEVKQRIKAQVEIKWRMIAGYPGKARDVEKENKDQEWPVTVAESCE